MKSLIALTLIFGVATLASPAQADCISGCTRWSCAGKKKWDDCFKNCYPCHKDQIPNCIEAARKNGNIDNFQKKIMDYLSS